MEKGILFNSQTSEKGQDVCVREETCLLSHSFCIYARFFIVS